MQAVEAYGIIRVKVKYGHTELVLTNETAEIVDMWVDEDHRREGYGTTLVKRCIGIADAIGCKLVCLHVTDKNVAARNLYRSLGFEPKEIETHMELQL